jgi:hypothetical protein
MRARTGMRGHPITGISAALPMARWARAGETMFETAYAIYRGLVSF